MAVEFCKLWRIWRYGSVDAAFPPNFGIKPFRMKILELLSPRWHGFPEIELGRKDTQSVSAVSSARDWIA